MKITVLTFRVNEIIINKLIKKLYWVSGFLRIGEKNLTSNLILLVVLVLVLESKRKYKKPLPFLSGPGYFISFCWRKFHIKVPPAISEKMVSAKYPASKLSVWGSREKSRDSHTREETRVRVASSLARAFSHGLLRSLARSLKCSVTYWICQT